MVEPVRLQPVPQRIWSPFGIVWVTVLFSAMLGGILHALNERRLGRERTWRFTLYRNLLVGLMIIAPSFLIDASGPRLLLGGNLFVAMYFYKSQMDPFERHVASGGSRSSFILPVLGAIAVIFILGSVFGR